MNEPTIPRTARQGIRSTSRARRSTRSRSLQPKEWTSSEWFSREITRAWTVCVCRYTSAMKV